MAELIGPTHTLGSERVSEVPGLMDVETISLQCRGTHAHSNQGPFLGSHIYAPFHFVDGTPTVEEMLLEEYVELARLLDLRPMARGLATLQVSNLKIACVEPGNSKGKLRSCSPGGSNSAALDATGTVPT